MKLVHDWKKFPRWYSTWIAAVGASAPAIWLQIPDDVRRTIPPEWLAYAGAAYFVLLLIGRLVEQPGA
jgi:hypothetical protein